MAAILRDSTVAVITVMHTHPQAIPLAMIALRKSIHFLYWYGAPLGGPSALRQSSTIEFVKAWGSTHTQELCYNEIHSLLPRHCYWITFNYYYF